jgi:myo-inositol-1-phosphate synthase
MGDAPADVDSEDADAGWDDLREVDSVWLGSEDIAGEEFVEALDAVRDVQASMRNVRDELRRLDVGLQREDAVDLLWGRTNLNKGQIEDAFRVMDIITQADPEEMAERLLADQSSRLTVDEAAAVWAELTELAEEYGTHNDTPDDDNDTTSSTNDD